eukprot:COSAG01_NODE_8540_length_2747_cov_11.361646_3_plen_100_part_00
MLWLRIETRDEIKIHILTLKDGKQRPEAANRLKPSDETAVPGQQRDPDLGFKQRRTQPHERFTADSAATWMVATVFAPTLKISMIKLAVFTYLTVVAFS